MNDIRVDQIRTKMCGNTAVNKTSKEVWELRYRVKTAKKTINDKRHKRQKAKNVGTNTGDMRENQESTC